jgi:hypothetical protein
MQKSVYTKFSRILTPNSKKFIRSKTKNDKILRKFMHFLTYFFNEMKVFTKKIIFENKTNLIIQFDIIQTDYLI